MLCEDMTIDNVTAITSEELPQTAPHENEKDDSHAIRQSEVNVDESKTDLPVSNNDCNERILQSFLTKMYLIHKIEIYSFT